MSDHSGEDLIGDVDFDFDSDDGGGKTLHQSKTKQVKESSGKIKPSSQLSSKQPVKKKPVKRNVTDGDDLLQAFAMGSELPPKPTIRKPSKTSNTDLKKVHVSASTNDGTSDHKERRNAVSDTVKRETKEDCKNQAKIYVKEKSEKVSHVIIETREETDSLQHHSTKSGSNKEHFTKEKSSTDKSIKNPTPLPPGGTSQSSNITSSKTVDQKAPSSIKTKLDGAVLQNTRDMKSNNSTLTATKISDKSSKTDVKTACPSLKRKTDDPPSHATAIKNLKKTEQSSSESKTPNVDDSSKGKNSETFDKKLTEEELKILENSLAEGMLNSVRQKPLSKLDAKYTVHVSPLELTDLVESSIQQLIQLHPTITLVFKHQPVKFKKKKGFAEAAFSTMTELKEFVYQLTQIKVFEKRIDVTIKALKKEQEPDVLSLVIHLNRNGKLLNLLDRGEDPMINKPIAGAENPNKIQFDQVPWTANAAFMHSMFPFTNNVVITKSQKGKSTTPTYCGPVSVYYLSSEWQEAVMECCTDFTVNGFRLAFKESSLLECFTDTKADPETEDESKRQESSMDAENESCDLVSNMTRDVCAEMLESLQKLKELEPTNPNMKKILEMQRQVSALQKSLKLSQEEEMKFPSIESSNKNKLTSSERKRKEMEELERKMEEADKVAFEKEKLLHQLRETEMQKKKDYDSKRKSQWARRVISDYKQEGRKDNKVSEEAEKFLREREQRMKDRKEEEKRKEDEKFKREQQMKEEAERNELERQRLIKKIEEARLRDSQRTDKMNASQMMWNSSGREDVSKKFGSPSKRDQDSSRRFSKSKEDTKYDAAGSSFIDDDMESRLAMFEYELAEQGKINRHTPSNSVDHRHQPHRVDVCQDTHIISEDEYLELCTLNRLHTLPANYKVHLDEFNNRLCPVKACPAKTCFRDKETFMDHWSIFHQANTTMRFCQKCSAYFMNPHELENHMMRYHQLSSKESDRMVENSRIKVIANPSYRDPSPFFVSPSSP